ncbi:MAG TPA: hypothetical protein VGY13_07015 [Solirubrobacteraceae bacterium]|jgi:hypothetical protein|nr:hypothetical protein [Solirubrobacteraceae bacterium]
MASSLVDSPSAGQAEPEALQAPDGTHAEGARQSAAATPASADGGAASARPAVARPCKKCGAPLLEGQDWCLQCGAGAPGSLGGAGWRGLVAVLGAVLVLVLGAGAAAYAALSKGSAKPTVLTKVVAQAPAPVTSTPATPPPTTPGTPAKTPKAAKGLPGLGSGKPPKIPLDAVTPKASEKVTTTPAGNSPTTPTTPTKPASTPPAGETPEENQQAAILLDTDAAKTYDPYGYPASWFGDPSLAIDGDTATAWTAQIDPATAPKLAEGLLIDLKSEQRVSVLQLVTSTPGMTVQVYGTAARTAPTSITDPAWVPLSAPRLAKKRTLRLALRDSKKTFSFVVLWISGAPKSAIGTPEAPGHVAVNELELFPTR